MAGQSTAKAANPFESVVQPDLADGWLVLRFAWEDVMDGAGYVRSVIESAVRLAVAQATSRRMVVSRPSTASTTA